MNKMNNKNENIKINNIKNLNFSLIGAICLYLILFLFKDLLLPFFNIDSTFPIVINIIYQILIIAISLMYYIKHKNTKTDSKPLINLLIGMLSISTYFLLSTLEIYILSIFGITTNSSQIIKSISLIIYSIIMIILLIMINKTSLKKDLIDFKKNHKKYFSKYLKYWFFAVLIMMFSNIIINILNNGKIAGNQETIVETFKVAPIYIYFSAIIFAPIVEELVFRRSLKNMITSKWAFIIASGLIFGGLHVVTNIESLIDFLYIIPYSCCGIAFAYVLYKTDNIFVTMGLHFLHNGIIMALETLLLILGAL